MMVHEGSMLLLNIYMDNISVQSNLQSSQLNRDEWIIKTAFNVAACTKESVND